MKLARFECDGRIDLGVVIEGGVIGLHEVGFGFSEMTALITAGSEVLDGIRQRTASAEPRHALDEVRLLAPLRPGKYLAIGMNYAKHVAEMGHAERPQHQYWFNKQTTCINGPFDPIDPGVTEMLDYEVELGVVIGRTAKGVGAAAALGHVFGYLVANDVSARDWQRHSPTFTMGKSFDTHGPIGPWIVTADEIGSFDALKLETRVNGEVRQSDSTANLIFPFEHLIGYISSFMTLEPGDIISTGTPPGAGARFDPPIYLKPGDVVEVSSPSIGTLRNGIVDG